MYKMTKAQNIGTKAQIKTKSTKHKAQNICVFSGLGFVFYLCFV